MRRLLLAIAATSLLSLASVAPAMGATYNPTGEYTQFGECPLNITTIQGCVYSVSSSGSFTLGSKTVPLKNPVTLQGGLEENEETGEQHFYAAANGVTLSKTPQPVPGGLLGIQAPSWWPSFLRNLFNETINNGFTGVTSTVELARPATEIEINTTNLISEQGVAMSLPVKIKLSNPFLGNNCYVGSSSNPVMLNFTSGTTSPPPPNQPIKGALGEASFNPSFTILTAKGGRLVDNAFAAPGANGCGGLFSFLIDPFVNSISGLPAPAGTNTAILEGIIQTGRADAVRASIP